MKKDSSLLKYLERLDPYEDFAKSVENTMKRTRRAKLRRYRL